MNLFKIFCLIFIFISISNGEEDKDKELKKHLEAINKWTGVGVEFVKAVQTENVDQCISAVLSLASAVPYLGPIASALSSILKLFGGPDSTTIALKEIQNTLNIMNSKLFAIERKVLDVVDEVQDQIIISEYKRHIDSVFLLQASYKRAVQDPTPSTKTDLVDKCHSQQFNMFNLINWIHKEVVTENLQPITRIMTREYDIHKFTKWSKSITSIYVQAIILHSVCIGAISKNATDITKTLDFDSKAFGQQSKDIANTLKVSLNNIKSKFWDHAKTEIETFMADNAALDHTAFAQRLFSMLSDKYSFRHWTVDSYSGSTAGTDNHSASSRSHSYHWVRIHGRCLFVSSTNSNSETVQTEVKNCINRKKSTQWAAGERALHVLNDMISCLGNNYESILVVFGDGLRGHYSYLGTAFVNSEAYGNSFSVVFVKLDDH